MKIKRVTAIGSALLLSLSLNACAPLMVAGFAGSAMVASDRRTSGTQLEDETIELRSSARVRDARMPATMGSSNRSSTAYSA